MQLSNRLAHTLGDTKSIKILGKILALRKLLNAKGISVENVYFYAHMLHIKGRVHAAYEFGKRSLSGEGETV